VRGIATGKRRDLTLPTGTRGGLSQSYDRILPPFSRRLSRPAGQGLDTIPVFLEPQVRSGAANHAVVFNPAGQPELQAGSNLFHPHCLGSASQVDNIAGLLRFVCWHDDIALDVLAGSYRLIQQAIESVFVDIPGARAEPDSRTVASHVKGPMERHPGLAAPFVAGVKSRVLERCRVGISFFCRGISHKLEQPKKSPHFWYQSQCRLTLPHFRTPLVSYVATMVLVRGLSSKYLDNSWVAVETKW